MPATTQFLALGRTGSPGSAGRCAGRLRPAGAAANRRGHRHPTPRTGPNRRYFGHLYVGYALAAGPSALGVRRDFSSSEVQLGGRLKQRLGPYFAFNTDLRYAYLRYGLATDAPRPLLFGAGFDSQNIGFHQVQGEASLRLNPRPPPGQHRGPLLRPARLWRLGL
ncbi:MAG: hypothetical protein WKG07_49780 [Hymenobacter sp.]